MSETTNNPEIQEEEESITPAQMAAYRKNMQQYYKEQLPLLKAQLEYERTIADIEEARVKAMTMVIRQAQLKAGPPREPEAPLSPEGNPEVPETETPKQERKLKTD
jgi:hypothetical protein